MTGSAVCANQKSGGNRERHRADQCKQVEGGANP